MVRCSHVVLIVASIVGVLSLAAVITLIVLWLTILSPFKDYALVVDAGSTHSKIFLYTWPADKSDGIGTTSKVTQVKACDVTNDAISSIKNPTKDTVRDYFNSAMTECINEIPDARTSRTLIFLGATAGLRLINITNPAYIRDLLRSTREYFQSLGLLFRSPDHQVRIISGSEEGLSGWITANLLMRQLYENNKPMETYGILDMGGASTQISFIAPQATTERFSMNLFNTNYDVYSHSYLCYGQEQTRLIYQGVLVQRANGSTLIDDPCLQAGFDQMIPYEKISSSACAIGRYSPPANFSSTVNVTFRGTGQYNACRALILERLNKGGCSSPANCSVDSVYQPSVNGLSLKFLAISAFYSSFNTLAPLIPLSANADKNFDLATMNFSQLFTAIRNVCTQPWSAINTSDYLYRPFLCFNSIYHWTLVQDGYSMNDGNIKNIQLVKNIDSNEIGWTLGYMINQTNYLEAEYRPARLLSQAEFIGILVCFLVLLVASIVAIVIVMIMRCRRGKKK